MKSIKFLDKELSRRDLLIGAGITAIAAAAPEFATKAEALGGSTEKWPWPYVKLDPQKTADIAYTEWYRVYCGAAVINSIFSQLREKVGEPYKSFPVDAFIFLEGGVSGWGTICGANAGPNIVTNVIIGPRTSGSEDGMRMGSELMQYYSETAMPTYTPKEPKFSGAMPKTTAGSPLCHVSVGKWMKAANKDLGSPDRRDRCARLTAAMAFQTVTLLNQWKDGKYQTKGTIPAMNYGIQSQHNCTDCHGDKVPSPPAKKA